MQFYALYASVEEMLAPENLSQLLQTPVKDVQFRSFAGQTGFSSSRLLTVETGPGADERFVLKRMKMGTDWTMRASADDRCRSVTLWQHGLLDQLRPAIEHAIVACCHDGDGWAILMRDISVGLFRHGQALSPQTIYSLLDGLAAMHAHFWQAPELRDPVLGLCDSAGLLQMFSPLMVAQLEGITTKHPEMLTKGWQILLENVAPEVAAILAQLMANPQPLLTVLNAQPWTLVHGNLQFGNMALLPSEPTQPVFFDWQTAGYSSAILDLAWLLDKGKVELSSVTKERAIDYYRGKLEEYLGNRFDQDAWLSMVEVGWLAHILRWGCFLAWFSAQQLKDQAHNVNNQFQLKALDGKVRAAMKWLST
ncbi:MAG: phosphotransferase [Caldilineaceae bacterium]